MTDSPKITYRYYSNPAFCGQSEVVYTQRAPCVSPRVSAPSQMPPPGAPSAPSAPSAARLRTDISDNALRNGAKGGSIETRPLRPVPKPPRRSRDALSCARTPEINLPRVASDCALGRTETRNEAGHGARRVLKHRYAEIQDDIDDYSPSKKRIVETEPEEYNVDTPGNDEFGEIPTEISRSVNGKVHRYAIIPSDEEDEVIFIPVKVPLPHYSPPTFHISSPGMSRRSLEATQKLHELLTTPKKRVCMLTVGSPNHGSAGSPPSTPVTPGALSSRLVTSTPKRALRHADLVSPPLPRRNSVLTSPISPRAQQKLIYSGGPEKASGIPDFFVREPGLDRSRDSCRRSTAVISPRLVSSHGRSPGACNLSVGLSKECTSPGCATLALAAAMMALCGALSAALSFYIMYSFGRKYYSDVGVLSGFTCLSLGLLGIRPRRRHLLPNRNYVSGYIILSVFSLLQCVALLAKLVAGEGRPLEAAVGGAVTGLGGLCILLAAGGAFASCCCRHPPPDNRVADV